MAIEPRKAPRRTGNLQPKTRPESKSLTARKYQGVLRKLQIKWSSNHHPYLVASFQLTKPLGRWASACVWGGLSSTLYQAEELARLGFRRGWILLQKYEGITNTGYWSPVSEDKVDQAILAWLEIGPAPNDPRWLQVKSMERWYFTPEDHEHVKLFLHRLAVHNLPR